MNTHEQQQATGMQRDFNSLDQTELLTMQAQYSRAAALFAEAGNVDDERRAMDIVKMIQNTLIAKRLFSL